MLFQLLIFLLEIISSILALMPHIRANILQLL